MAKTKEGQAIQWPKQKKNRQYNGPKKRRTDNTMGKPREQSMQWPKQTKDRQYIGQKKRTDNAMAKGKRTKLQTMI